MGNELTLFMKSLWCGAFLLMVYDGLRIFRRVVPHSPAAVGVEDFFFWVGSGLYLFSRVFQENEGALRGYFLLGAAAGMAAWHWSLSEYSVKYLSKLLGIPWENYLFC